MKIQPDHIAHMREAIAPLAPKLMPHFTAVTNNAAAKNPAMRTRWDALYAAGLGKWICDTLYSYANDEHIDTALRSIMRDLNLPDLSA